MGEPFQPLTIPEIVGINAALIRKFGGFAVSGGDNLQNRASLEYVLDSAIFPIRCQDRFPAIPEKMAAIAHAIITRHVFHDGNKGGLAVLLVLADLNSLEFRTTREDEDFIVRIAAESLDVAEVAQWIKGRLRLGSK